MSSEAAHVLYRFFNKAGELLYIGITNDPINRFTHHSYQKTWFKEVTSSTMENFDSREALVEAEKQAIQSESPRHNKLHSVRLPKKKTVAPRGAQRRPPVSHVSGGNKFPRPDAIALEEPEREVYRTYSGCPDCGTWPIEYEVRRRGKSRYICSDCGGEWTWLEYGDALGMDGRPLLERLAKAAEAYRGRFT